MKRGKKYRKSLEHLQDPIPLSIESALDKIGEFEKTAFDETMELAVNLNVDPRQSDQQVRGSISLPHGIGREFRVIAFAEGDKAEEATKAGAMEVGSAELGKKIEDGWTDFDVVVATPDMMRVVGKLGRILGPKGLMPSPKVGTVTPDIADVVEAFRKGKIEYRIDNTGNIHAPVGKRSFSREKLTENIQALLDELIAKRPSAVKGIYIKSAFICASMSPSVPVAVE